MTQRSLGLAEALAGIHRRPEPFATYTADVLWNDDHISRNMLAHHLAPDTEPASRPHGFVERSAEWITGRFALGPGRRVADFGCGPGLYTTRFAATGAEVTGIDVSRRSIDYARNTAGEQGQRIDYVQTNYLDCRLEPGYDLITLIYCDLCALSPDQRRILLTGFAGLLADGGSLLLDVFSRRAYRERQEASSHGYRLMDGFWSAGDYWGFLSTFKYDEPRVVLDRYTIVEPHRTWCVDNWLQYFTREELAAEFAACGLKIIEWYGDVAGAPRGEEDLTMAVVACRA